MPFMLVIYTRRCLRHFFGNGGLVLQRRRFRLASLFLLLLPSLLDDLVDSGIDECLQATAKAGIRLDHVPEVVKVNVVEGGIVARAVAVGALGTNPSEVVGKGCACQEWIPSMRLIDGLDVSVIIRALPLGSLGLKFFVPER